MDGLIPVILASLALSGSPGPNTLSLAAVGAAFGTRGGQAYMWGLNLGMVGVTCLVGTGIAGLILSLPGVTPIATGLAAVYFLYLAYKIATAPPGFQRQSVEAAPPPRDGVLLSMVNPKAYAAVAAVMAGHSILPSTVWVDQAVKGIVFLSVVLVVNITWLSLGAALTSHLQDPKRGRIANIVFAVLLLVSVGSMLFL
ncbi:MAG: LysE family translocator [Pseudomonadota bacterium]